MFLKLYYYIHSIRVQFLAHSLPMPYSLCNTMSLISVSNIKIHKFHYAHLQKADSHKTKYQKASLLICNCATILTFLELTWSILTTQEKTPRDAISNKNWVDDSEK